MAAPDPLAQQYPSWKALRARQRRLARTTLPALFRQDPERSTRFSASAAGLTLDYSRNPLDSRTLELLAQLWQEARLPQAVRQLLDGEPINSTEQRPAWHSALRQPSPPREVAETLQRMAQLCEAVRGGQWRGYSGKAISDIVNIGIGGSDLGPRMVCHALHLSSPMGHKALRCHFVANVDPQDLLVTLQSLNPETTLFVIASKSFSTLETLANARLAREWFLQSASEAAIAKHFVAVSTAIAQVKAFGIAEANIFPLWDWVGGRYSLWSAIGLPIALGFGMETFRQLLAGAHAMDEHFRSAPLIHNLPGLLGLLEIGYTRIFDARSHVILPYSQALKLFPDFLQQLEMESNGKSVTRKGQPLQGASGAVVWGSAGTLGQHSFHQLLHQGTGMIPADFILPLQSNHKLSSQARQQQRHLVANCLAQSEALLYGQDLATVKKQLRAQGMSASEIKRLAPHKVIPGNRFHNLITLDTLTAETLGALVALYEHKVYVQSVVLGINAFDQWGVELGKQLSKPLYDALGNNQDAHVDPAYQALVQRYRHLQH